MSNKLKRHAAVRPDVFARNQRLRTWVWVGDEMFTTVAWITELDVAGNYLRCFTDGAFDTYWASGPPTDNSTHDRGWKEIKG